MEQATGRTGMQMDDLIERLEKATGADREIDAELAVLAGRADSKLTAEELLVHDKEGWRPKYVLRYTASIDAALTLVPDSAGLQLERYWLRRPEAAWRATLYTGGVPSNPARRFSGEDTYTPAIALCIAALKARQALTEQATGFVGT